MMISEQEAVGLSDANGNQTMDFVNLALSAVLVGISIVAVLQFLYKAKASNKSDSLSLMT